MGETNKKKRVDKSNRDQVKKSCGVRKTVYL